MIVMRVCGFEVLAFGREEDEILDEPGLAGGPFELADLEDEEGTVYLRLRRQRPPVVAVGGGQAQRGGQAPAFGFTWPKTARSSSQ